MRRFPIRLFNAKRLAQELGRKEVSPRAFGYYLAASFLLYIPLGYCGFIHPTNPLWSWLSIYEGFAVFAITVLGLATSYSAGGGDDNPDFVTEFICLSVPVFFTTTLIVWAVYWGISIGFRETLEAYSYRESTNFAFIRRLYDIHADISNLLSFLAVVSIEAIGFYRMTRLFHVVRSSSPSQ